MAELSTRQWKCVPDFVHNDRHEVFQKLIAAVIDTLQCETIEAVSWTFALLSLHFDFVDLSNKKKND